MIQFSVIDYSWFDAAGEFFRVATGGLVAATITLYFNGRRHKREEHRAAAQLSARLIDIFERFAIACASIPDDHARNQRESPYDYSGIAGLPKLEELPEDEFGWRALEHQSAIDALTFGTHVDLARDFIRAASEHGDADEVEAAVERKAAELGQKAWQLSCRFRTQYGYNPANFGLDIGGHFSEELSRFQKMDADAKIEARKFWDELFPDSERPT